MRILVTGANGQVGRSILDLNGQDGHKIIGLTSQQFDLTTPEKFDRIVDQVEPDAIVNAAAYTAVDRAEDERELALQVNAIAPGVMSSIAAKSGLPFIQISTDYVFEGSKGEPYTERDRTGPVNVYGKTKLAGELAVLDDHPGATVLRTSWVFSKYGSNFVKTISRALIGAKPIQVVDDQLGCPTSADSVARTCVSVLEARLLPGIYHFAGSQTTSWFEFACLVEKQLGTREASKIERCRSDRYASRAARPANTVLDCAKIMGELGLPRTDLSVQISNAMHCFEATS